MTNAYMNGCSVGEEAPPLGRALGEPELDLADRLLRVLGRLVNHPLLQLLNPPLRRGYGKGTDESSKP